MLGAAASLALAAVACLGIGVGCLRLFPLGAARCLAFGEVGLLGVAALAALGATINLVLPLTPWPAMVLSAGGAVLLVLGWRGAAPCLLTDWRSAAVPALLLAGILLALLPAMLRSSAWHFDSGLYHMQHVRQAMELPVVLGMASIHERFGYNSLWFPAAALATAGVPGVAGAFSLNALLAGFVLLAMAERTVAAIRTGQARVAVFGTLVVGLLVLTPVFTLRGWIGSPNTDIPVTLLALYAFLLGLQYTEADEDRFAIAGILTATVALAVAVKLSALPLLLLLLLPIVDWWRGRMDRRQVALLAVIGLALGMPWLLRGIATSGCLAYPQPASCLPLPWTIDPAVARGDMDWVRAWARLPGVPPEVVLADRSWMLPWAREALADPVLPFVGALAALAVVLAAVSLRRRRLEWRGPGMEGAILLAAALGALAFWFATAPLIRYGRTFMLLPLLLAVAMLAPPAAIAWVNARLPARGLGPGILAIGVVALAVHAGMQRPRGMPLGLGGYPVLPQVAVRPLPVPGMLPVTQPIEGQQCWDAPRLCTPALHRPVTVERVGPWFMVRAAGAEAPAP
ncbi:LIC_10190 family membrane protein [Roseomonas fluvialis]|uniref:DUF8201 domain-containing protein n=1 Tax=Roseomonas fluvialis TaxID=1750527 RepID=A0ABM7YAZ6_9PROT|nr:hypothetical protein [Roseomonas fluvialis]BDG75147.1 hypothetical protein Rmf_50760 [Roseomonas fluvialis]